MQLQRRAVEWYTLEITTDPPVPGWEASFDDGASWVESTPVGSDGYARWLVAGPDSDEADRGTATVLNGPVTPLLRVKDNPEVIVRRPPSIYLYA